MKFIERSRWQSWRLWTAAASTSVQGSHERPALNTLHPRLHAGVLALVG